MFSFRQTGVDVVRTLTSRGLFHNHWNQQRITQSFLVSFHSMKNALRKIPPAADCFELHHRLRG